MAKRNRPCRRLRRSVAVKSKSQRIVIRKRCNTKRACRSAAALRVRASDRAGKNVRASVVLKHDVRRTVVIRPAVNAGNRPRHTALVDARKLCIRCDRYSVRAVAEAGQTLELRILRSELRAGNDAIRNSRNGGVCRRYIAAKIAVRNRSSTRKACKLASGWRSSSRKRTARSTAWPAGRHWAVRALLQAIPDNPRRVIDISVCDNLHVRVRRQRNGNEERAEIYAIRKRNRIIVLAGRHPYSPVILRIHGSDARRSAVKHDLRRGRARRY